MSIIHMMMMMIFSCIPKNEIRYTTHTRNLIFEIGVIGFCLTAIWYENEFLCPVLFCENERNQLIVMVGQKYAPHELLLYCFCSVAKEHLKKISMLSNFPIFQPVNLFKLLFPQRYIHNTHYRYLNTISQ